MSGKSAVWNKYAIVAVIVAIVTVGAFAVYYWELTGHNKQVSTSEGKKYLVVGTSPDFPPFEYVASNGSIVGIDIELVKHLAKMMGYNGIKIVSIDFDGLIPALTNGKIDVIAAGMTITEERKKVVAFTIPYWSADQAILVTKNSNFKPKDLSDLKGKVVAVQSGTTGESLVDDFINKTGAKITVKRYSSFVLAVRDLLNGRVDAVIVDSPVAKLFTQKYGVEIATTINTGEHYGLAVRKDNTQLLNTLNEALKKFLSSPEWKAIIDKYTGSAPPS